MTANVSTSVQIRRVLELVEKQNKQKMNAVWKCFAEMKYANQAAFSEIKRDVSKALRDINSVTGIANFGYAFVAKANADESYNLPMGYSRQQKKQPRGTVANVYELSNDKSDHAYY